MSSPRPATLVMLAALLVLGGAREAAAQRHAQSASIAVTLRVLPIAAFEGGSTHTLAVLVAPGTALRVDPAAGVRTRMSYNAPTRVVATAGRFRGPAGAEMSPRLVCAHGAPAAAVVTVGFDCSAGFVTSPAAQAATLPLGIGASLTAEETLRLPAGLYVGQVTLIASHPAS